MSGIWLACAALGVLGEVVLGRIFRMLWLEHRQDWEELGQPIATFWRPPGLRAEFPNVFLSARTRAGYKLALRFLFKAPLPFANSPRMGRGILMYRSLAVLAAVAVIFLEATT